MFNYSHLISLLNIYNVTVHLGISYIDYIIGMKQSVLDYN